MKCKHCGKEIMAITVYLTTENLQPQAAQPAQVQAVGFHQLEADGRPIFFPGSAASAVIAPGMWEQFLHAHEPAAEE